YERKSNRKRKTIKGQGIGPFPPLNLLCQFSPRPPLEARRIRPYLNQLRFHLSTQRARTRRKTKREDGPAVHSSLVERSLPPLYWLAQALSALWSRTQITIHRTQAFLSSATFQ